MDFDAEIRRRIDAQKTARTAEVARRLRIQETAGIMAFAESERVGSMRLLGDKLAIWANQNCIPFDSDNRFRVREHTTYFDVFLAAVGRPRERERTTYAIKGKENEAGWVVATNSGGYSDSRADTSWSSSLIVRTDGILVADYGLRRVATDELVAEFSLDRMIGYIANKCVKYEVEWAADDTTQ